MIVGSPYAARTGLVRVWRVLLLVLLAMTDVVSADPGTVTFAGLSVRINSAPQGACHIKLSYPGDAKVVHFALSDPSRIVVDIAASYLNTSKSFPLPNNSCVSSVRFGLHPGSTRIVFDVGDRGMPEYSAVPSAEGLEFVYGGSSPSEAEKAVRAPVATSTPHPTATASATWTATVTATAKPTLTPTSEPTVPPLATRKATAIPTRTPTIAPPTKTPKATATSVPTRTAKPTAVIVPPTPTVMEITPGVSSNTVLKQAAKLQFSVDQVLVELPAGEPPVKTLLVTNTSEQTLHMTARASALTHPGTQDEEESDTKELLVSPLQFDLAVGEQRRVRLVAVGAAPSIEQSYRIHLVPLEGEFDPMVRFKLKGVSSQLTVVTALAVLVLRKPDNQPVTLLETREKGRMKLQNNGNQSVLLSDIKICNAHDSKKCREIPGRRLFAGNSWEIALRPDENLELVQHTSRDFQPLRIAGAQ